MRLLFLTMAGLCLCITPAAARPISYPGGWTFMTMNNGNSHMLHFNYSPTANYALGYSLEYMRDRDYTLNTLQMNNLLKRWNNPDSQGNLYLQSGLGLAYSDQGNFDSKTNAAGFTGLTADWENRRFFLSYENRYVEAGVIDNSYMQSARVGVTPYIGNYGDLHTWVMLQIDHKPESEDNFTVTPLVRMFRSDHLIEAGISNKGDLMFNWTIRY